MKSIFKASLTTLLFLLLLVILPLCIKLGYDTAAAFIGVGLLLFFFGGIFFLVYKFDKAIND